MSARLLLNYPRVSLAPFGEKSGEIGVSIGERFEVPPKKFVCLKHESICGGFSRHVEQLREAGHFAFRATLLRQHFGALFAQLLGVAREVAKLIDGNDARVGLIIQQRLLSRS